MDLFSRIYAGSELKFQDEAKRKWKVCFENKFPEDSLQSDLLLYPYSGGTQYVKKQLLNCINKNEELALLNILERAAKKLSITISSEATKKFILDMYIGHFTSTMQNLVDHEKEKEFVQINEKIKFVKSEVTNHLTDNRHWINKAKNENDLMNACRDEYQVKLQSVLGSKNTEATDFNFHTTSDEQTNEEVCNKIVNSKAVMADYENQQKLKINNALKSIDEILLQTAEPSMKSCKAKFYKNTSSLIKSRNNCLTSNSIWNPIMLETVDNWLVSESFTSSLLAKKLALYYLEAKKPELRTQATKKMNSK